MAVRITIEVRNKGAARIVAQHLPVEARPASWRGLGVIRLEARNAAETEGIVDAVSALVEEQHDLGWVRIRYEDEYRVFRSNGRGS